MNGIKRKIVSSLIGCVVVLSAMGLGIKAADEVCKTNDCLARNLMALDSTTQDMVNLYATGHALLVNGIGSSGATTCEIKKKSISAGATSSTYLNPSSSSTSFMFKNESDNTVCFAPISIAITADNSMCLDAYGAAFMDNITVVAFSTINTGADSATMTVMFCR